MVELEATLIPTKDLVSSKSFKIDKINTSKLTGSVRKAEEPISSQAKSFATPSLSHKEKFVFQ